MKLNAPCKNCNDRYFGCHSNCIKYKEFFEENEKQKEFIRKTKKFNDILNKR